MIDTLCSFQTEATTLLICCITQCRFYSLIASPSWKWKEERGSTVCAILAKVVQQSGDTAVGIGLPFSLSLFASIDDRGQSRDTMLHNILK
eukprot:scaffold111_cov142-Skeletonema_menzelii.AAC.24